jgi:hypothetical protein
MKNMIYKSCKKSKRKNLFIYSIFKKSFQPDYTSDEVNETLILNTNIGLIKIPIFVRISQRVLSTCYKTIFRPYCLCLCSLFIVIVLIFASAVFDARQLFDNVNENE